MKRTTTHLQGAGRPMGGGPALSASHHGGYCFSFGGHSLPAPPPEPSQHGGGRQRRSYNMNANLKGVTRTVTPYFDGHLWRKYGQKIIKYTPYPRLYYRCSYREDRQCMASKMVQQLNNDDPPLFEVTYTYQHTCKAEPVPAPDIGDAMITGPPQASTPSDGFVLSFGSSSGGDGDAPAQQKRQRNHSHQPVAPPSPLSETMGFGSSNSQLHENPDDFSAAAASWFFPTESCWAPSPLLPSISDEGGLFPVWDSFGGSGFDDDPPFSTFPETMSSWQTNN